MAEKDRMLIEELEKRLLWYRDEAVGEEFDVEEVDAICTLLEKLDPIKPRKSKEDAFEEIMRQIRAEEESGTGEDTSGADGKGEERESAAAVADREDTVECSREVPIKPHESKEDAFEERSNENTDGRNHKRSHRFIRRKRGLRAAIITIAVIGVLFSLDRVTYARENRSLFTMILEKVGWLEIEKEEGVEGVALDTEWAGKEFYNSWADLDMEIKKKINVPKYVPEGYTLYGIKYWNAENRDIIQAEYFDEKSGHILFEITLWEDSVDHYKEKALDEKECKLLSEFSDETTLYYSYEDEYVCMVFMDKSFYRISGNISLDQMIKCRDGLEEK